MREFLKNQRYTGWLLLAVILAFIFPEPGSPGGIFYPEFTNKFGVWFIFLLQGLSMKTGELVRGYRPLRVHGYVLGWNFLGFPLLLGGWLLIVGSWIAPEFRLGFWALAILPTTIASSVAFTAVAGGNVPTAIFSSIASNLLAVLIVPAIAIRYFAVEMEAAIPVGPLFRTLGLLIIFPLVLGQGIRSIAPKAAALVGQRLKPVPNWIILFLVHTAFAKSITTGFFDGLPVHQFVVVLLVAGGFLLLANVLVWFGSGLLKVDRATRVSALFCGGQKSLATGFPLITSILAVSNTGLAPAAVLMPLLCYHPLQLVLAGVLIGRLTRSKGG
ncbi:MAG: bile acid:sodium symporter family protein [Puniceicoccaceae bacterium]